MKKILVILVLLFGCTDGEEYASINLKKGDEFFAKREYEIAEYYFDKIPEESPLYKAAKRNLDIIHKQKEMLAQEETVNENTRAGVGAGALTVVPHSYSLKMGRIPIHTVTLHNKTTKKLQFADLEFIYLDGSGREVKRIVGSVYQDIMPDEQKEISEIAPGMVTDKFESVTIVVKRTLFY